MEATAASIFPVHSSSLSAPTYPPNSPPRQSPSTERRLPLYSISLRAAPPPILSPFLYTITSIHPFISPSIFITSHLPAIPLISPKSPIHTAQPPTCSVLPLPPASGHFPSIGTIQQGLSDATCSSPQTGIGTFSLLSILPVSTCNRQNPDVFIFRPVSFRSPPQPYALLFSFLYSHKLFTSARYLSSPCRSFLHSRISSSQKNILLPANVVQGANPFGLLGTDKSFHKVKVHSTEILPTFSECCVISAETLCTLSDLLQ